MTARACRGVSWGLMSETREDLQDPRVLARDETRPRRGRSSALVDARRVGPGRKRRRGQPHGSRQAPAADPGPPRRRDLPHRSGHDPSRGVRGGDGSHVEPDPRRPAEHGQRSDAPGPAGVPRRPRRIDGHPRGLRAPEPRVRDPRRRLGQRSRPGDAFVVRSRSFESASASAG